MKKASVVIANVITNFETQFPFEGSVGIVVLKQNGRHLQSVFLVARMFDKTIQSSIENHIVMVGSDVVHIRRADPDGEKANCEKSQTFDPKKYMMDTMFANRVGFDTTNEE